MYEGRGTKIESKANCQDMRDGPGDSSTVLQKRNVVFRKGSRFLLSSRQISMSGLHSLSMEGPF